jgi:hypothetical protein
MCERIEGRYRQGIKRRGSPYGKKKPSKLGLRSNPGGGYIIETEEDREILRAYNREKYHHMTPEQRLLRREYNRIYAEIRRRRAGIPQRNFRNRRTVVDEEGYELVSVYPIARWIRENYGTNGGVGKLAREIHMEDRQIRRIAEEEINRVKLSTVDAILVLSSQGGNPALLFHLYPSLYE